MKKMNEGKLLLLGGGGHCKSVIDSLLRSYNFTEIAIIDVKENLGKEILDKKVIGTDDDLKKLYLKGYLNAFVTVGSVGDIRIRKSLFELLKRIGFNIPVIVDLSAIVSENVRMESGVFVGKNAVINTGTKIGQGSIINTGAIIEHDCIVKDFVHLAPGAVICGDVIIEENVHIGANAVVKQKIIIGRNTMIGMGSVVINQIAPNSVAFGNPCTIKTEKANNNEK